MAKVELVNYTPNVWGSICHAAENCYCKPVTPELAREIIERGHSSIAEFSFFHFHIEDMSRICSQQVVRHRIGVSVAQRSQRYVDESNFSYVIPPSVSRLKYLDPDLYLGYSDLMNKIQNVYERLAKHVPKEDARYVLPNACETHLDLAFNARSLMHFCGLRLCRRAQWEVRDIANQMTDLIRNIDPLLGDVICRPKCGPLGYCPEGSGSCGRVPTKPTQLD